MRNVSSNFIEASLSPVGYANAYIEIGQTRIDASNITDITIQTDICEGGAYTIGSFCTAEASMTIVSDALPNVVTAQPIKIYFGYYIPQTGDYEYVPMGIFYAEPRDVSHKNLLTTIKAHDMSWAMVDSFTTALTYPTSVATVLAEIQTALNLTYGTYGGLAPSSVTVYEAPQGSYRDVLAQMALLMGTSAKFNRSGALDFIKVMPSTPVQDYGAYDYIADNYQLTSNQPMAFGVLTVNYTHEVTTGQGEEQETEEVTDTYTYSAPSGSHGITIDTHNIRSQAETNTLGQSMLGNGISYYGYSATLPGQPQIDLGDTIELTEPLGDTYEFIVLSATHQFNGAMKSTFNAIINDSDPSVEGGNISGSLAEQVSVIANALGRQTRLLADTIAANHAEFNELSANKADIDFANVDTATISTAWVKDLMIQGGLLSQSGTFYDLTGVRINGDLITANTLKADRLLLQGTNGLYYALNVDALGQATASSDPKYQEAIDGKVIVAHSITADELTVNNIVGTGGWINLANGTFYYSDATTGEYISWQNGHLTMDLGANTLVRAYSNGVLVAKSGNTVGALVNANGSFDVVPLTWSGNTPTAGTGSLATFGSTVRIGAETNGNVQITPLGIDIYNGQLDNVFHAGLSTNTMTYERYLVGPLKVACNTTVNATIPTLANGTTVYYEVASGTVIYRDTFTFGTAVSGGDFEYDGGTRITYTNGSATTYDFLTVYLNVTDEVAPAWTFGARVGDIGGFSTAVGLNCEASQNYAYAIGQTAKATGFLSFAQGSYVTASGTWQHVIGKWNIIDTADNYAFIIGNGSAAGGRSNALTVDWSGNVVATSFTGALYGNATSSTVAVRATYASYYSSDTIGITAYSTNEINFVGSSTVNHVYIGYRALESPQISNYYFCDSSASTNGRGNIYCGALSATGIATSGAVSATDVIINGMSLIYIVETGSYGGSSGRWEYVKWSDGRVELWGYFSQSVTSYATNSFVIGSSSVSAYPFTITAPRTVVTGQRIGTGGCVVDYDYGRTDYWSGIAHGTVTSWPQGSTQTITWTCYVNAKWQ